MQKVINNFKKDPVNWIAGAFLAVMFVSAVVILIVAAFKTIAGKNPADSAYITQALVASPDKRELSVCLDNSLAYRRNQGNVVTVGDVKDCSKRIADRQATTQLAAEQAAALRPAKPH